MNGYSYAAFLFLRFSTNILELLIRNWLWNMNYCMQMRLLSFDSMLSWLYRVRNIYFVQLIWTLKQLELWRHILKFVDFKNFVRWLILRNQQDFGYSEGQNFMQRQRICNYKKIASSCYKFYLGNPFCVYLLHIKTPFKISNKVEINNKRYSRAS